MFLFLRLYLAHLIADFPLQTDRIFALKMKGLLGVCYHVLVCVAVGALFMAPHLMAYPELWWAIAYFGLIHVVFDQGKIWYSRFTGYDSIYLYFLDQFFHLISIVGLIHLFPHAQETVRLGPEWGLLATAYDSDRLMLVGIALLLATYVMDISFDQYKRTYEGYRGAFQRDIPGMWERAFIIALFAVSPGTCFLSLLLIPLAVAWRRNRNRIRGDAPPFAAISPLLAACVGLLLVFP